ncbi:MAG: hypothetical protein AAFR61_26095 [Bacteroidota bacterium]
MDAFFNGLVAISLLGLTFFLLRRLARLSRRKTTLYKHRSELDATPMSYHMETHEWDKLHAQNESSPPVSGEEAHPSS